MGSLVAELAEKLSSATNNFDIDEGTIYVNTSADTVGIGTTTPASKLDVQGTMQVGVDDTGHDVKFFGATAGAYMLWDESADDLIIIGGNVGIGTTAPASIDGWGNVLEIYSATGADLILNHSDASATQGLGQITFARDNATLASVNGVTGSTTALYLTTESNSSGDVEIWLGHNYPTSGDWASISFDTGDNLLKLNNSASAADTNFVIDDSGNVGLGVAPLATYSTLTSLRIGGNALIQHATAVGASASLEIGQNTHYDTDNSWEYISTDEASRYTQFAGEHIFFGAASGTAGDNISWTEALRIKVDGKVGIGTSAPAKILDIVGSTDNGLLEGVQITNTDYGVGEAGQSIAINFKLSQAGTATKDAGRITVGKDDYWADNASADSHMTFKTRSNDTFTEHMRITSAGYVGIGTTAPVAALSIEGNNNTTSEITLKNTSPSPDAFWAITAVYDQDSLAFRSVNNTYGNRLLLTADGALTLTASEGSSASLYLVADEGDDNGDGWRINSNQDDNDLTISSNASGSYVDKVTIKSNGIITSPSQPAFQVGIDSTKTSGTNFNSTNAVPFNNEIIDTNADFNTTTRTFTAPVTGSYQLNVLLYVLDIPAEDGYIECQIISSNRAYYIIYDPAGQDTTSTYHTFCNSVVADMDASDTVSCSIVYTISAGFRLSSACLFSGFLIG